ncbi:MAG: SDR family oxidoreductase [Bacteroidota bacterium]
MNIVVTGATKGIGRAVADIFAANGFNLAICSRNESELLQYKAELEARYMDINVIVRKTDMSVKGEVIAFAEFVKNHWEKIDVLVNNAGVFFPGEIHKEDEGTLESMINTNLYSAYYLTRTLLPAMLPHKKGHIFNMCSIASIMAYPNGGSYSISKFALLGFSKVLRAEMKDKGIRVTSVLPGATWSASWEGVDLPDERLMKAEDIAKAIWGAYELSGQTVIEELLLRPQLGDL